MTHLELENLASDYLEGQLDTARHAEVDDHLAGCDPCREMVEDIRLAIEACQTADQMIPPPWLVPKIRLATTGEVRTGVAEQVGALLRAIRQPRVAYAVAMTVFSLSLLVNVTGLSLRSISVQDLNPGTWAYRANRAGHLLYARAERFYDDLRIVYEIESRFRNAQSQPSEKEDQTSRPAASPGRPASSVGTGGSRMASVPVIPGPFAQLEPGELIHEMR